MILYGVLNLVEKYFCKYVLGKLICDCCYLCEDVGFGEGDFGYYWVGDYNLYFVVMIELIDDGVGCIMVKFEEFKFVENMILIFISDNGGELNVIFNVLFCGGKSELYEGGICVFLIVCWLMFVFLGVICEYLI